LKLLKNKMKIPYLDQLKLIDEVLHKSIRELIRYDSSIFNIDFLCPERISNDAKILNRELHETTINHRLAYYIEKNIQNTALNAYNVDIEYNRFYKNSKLIQTIEGQLSIRPDIVIHSRINRKINPQHFLAIEAKKYKITDHDTNKIKGLISDNNYNYLFGLAIPYCFNPKFIVANLYYFDGKKMTSKEIKESK